MPTVNDKGSIGVAKAISDLLGQAYYVFLPFDGSSPVDLVVANAAMVLRRVQVKYRIIEWNMLRIPLSSVTNGNRKPIDLSKLDGWAVYCPDTDKMYYAPNRKIEPGAKMAENTTNIFAAISQHSLGELSRRGAVVAC